MLRITTVAGTGDGICLRVEGRLTQHTVGELERECHPYLARHQIVQLDLSQLTFADKAGANVLRRLLRQGALRGDCSTFLSWLLDEREENRDE